VYADGRVISWSGPQKRIKERRLTPEGVGLVRSGAILPEELLPGDGLPGGDGLPADVWEDPEVKPFVPSRYLVWYGRDVDEDGSAASPLLRYFPAPARAILLRADQPGFTCIYITNFCRLRVVTTDEARALFEILGGMTGGGIEDEEGVEVSWEMPIMMLPDGRPPPCTGCF
jgi:hypothetical protein